MKNLLLSSFLAITLGGCTLVHYKKRVPPSAPLESGLKPVFGEHFNSFLFKTNISIYGKDFSGLLITKQMQPADYRVIFTTELGMKLFDFEFTDTAFTLHYCIPQFNRPALLRTIQEDIEILLMNKLNKTHIDYFSDKQYKYSIQRLKAGKFFDYYSIDNKQKEGQLVKIEHVKRRVKKTTFTLDNYRDAIPEHILIKHHNIKLKIELTLLKK